MIRQRLGTRPRPQPLPGMGLLVPADVTARFTQAGWQDPTAAAAPAAASSSPPAQTPEDLASEAEAYFKDYGGRSLAAPSTPAYDARPPWIEMPGGAQPFIPQGYIATPAANGTDTTVQTLLVPPGWDGVITQLANFYTGAGFTLGSAYLTFRLERNGQAIKGLDNIQLCFGQYGNGGLIPLALDKAPIRIFSGETISWVVNHAMGSPLPVGNTFVVSVIGGYFYQK
jgi:hypothetical protein